MNIQMCLGKKLLQLGVLAFQFLEPLGVGGFHAAIFGSPLMERGITETSRAAQLLDRHPGFRLFEKTNDLFFSESALLHIRHSPSFDGLLYFKLVRLAGSRSDRPLASAMTGQGKIHTPFHDVPAMNPISPSSLPCPACRQPMTSLSLAKRTQGDVELDLCFQCQGIWFDSYESFQITPGGIVELFKLIHAHQGDSRQPYPNNLHCPRCNDPLTAVKDVARSGRFNYQRCLQKHGRFIVFSQFMIEKGFVRQLNPAEISALSVRVGTIRCSGCGAPIDMRSESTCSHCGAPIAILDEKAVASALAGYQKDEDKRHNADPEAIAEALLSIERQRQKSELIPGHPLSQADLGDLIFDGLVTVGRWLAS